MIYKFRSKAAGDVLMLGPSGDEVLRRIGKAPAPTGIFAAAGLAETIAALERAVAEDDAARERACADGGPAGDDAVSLRQRAWPLLDMMRRSAAEGADIVWGV